MCQGIEESPFAPINHAQRMDSFSNREVAAVLNAQFISIKVDREERPDVDRLFMAFIQATIGYVSGLGIRTPRRAHLLPSVLVSFVLARGGKAKCSKIRGWVASKGRGD